MNRSATPPLSFRTAPDRALEAYERDGYFVEPDLFDARTCDRLIAEGEALPRAEGAGDRPIVQPHRVRPSFLEAMKAPALVAIMRRLCGGPIVGLQSEFFFGRPGTPGFAAHQDNYFVEAAIGTFASAWLALVDIGPENGGLVVYPGTHGRMLPVRTLDAVASPNQDPNARAQEVVLPPGAKGEDVRVKKGDVVLLHGLVAHGSHNNDSQTSRYVLLNTYLRRGGKFRSGNYAARSPVELDT